MYNRRMHPTSHTGDSIKGRWEKIEANTGIDRLDFQDKLAKLNDSDLPGDLNVSYVKNDKSFMLYGEMGKWECKYTFHPEKKVLFIEQINVFRHGQRMAGQVLQRLAEFGRETGLFDNMQLAASGYSGGGAFAWARYGFTPDQREWDSIRMQPHRLLKVMNDIRAQLKHPEEAKDALDLVARLMDNKDPRSLWAIADIGQRVEFKDGSAKKLGAAIMSKTPWCGHFKLDDPLAIERLNAYTQQGRERSNAV